MSRTGPTDLRLHGRLPCPLPWATPWISVSQITLSTSFSRSSSRKIVLALLSSGTLLRPWSSRGSCEKFCLRPCHQLSLTRTRKVSSVHSCVVVVARCSSGTQETRRTAMKISQEIQVSQTQPLCQVVLRNEPRPHLNDSLLLLSLVCETHHNGERHMHHVNPFAPRDAVGNPSRKWCTSPPSRTRKPQTHLGRNTTRTDELKENEGNTSRSNSKKKQLQTKFELVKINPCPWVNKKKSVPSSVE